MLFFGKMRKNRTNFISRKGITEKRMNKELQYLEPNETMDYEQPVIQDFVRKHTDLRLSKTENAVKLYYAVRDEFYYDPYQISFSPDHYRASFQISRKTGHCIDKATILGACARAIGIPSRLHFANVRNHIGTEKIEQVLGTSVLVFHGYVELFLEEKWVKATPAFNKALCEKLKVKPLEFDGKEDSVFQEFDQNGGKFMEYLHDYGHFPNLPFETMIGEWKKHYPKFQELDDMVNLALY